MLYTSVMPKNKKDRPLYQRVLLDIAGFGLIIVSPFTGVLPGPGGIPVFLAGLGLVALNHEWAENLLKNFEKKREQFTEKVLMASPKISRTIDVFGLILIAGGIFLAAIQDNIILRGIGIATVSITLILLLSNQKRFERIAKFFKKS